MKKLLTFFSIIIISASCEQEVVESQIQAKVASAENVELYSRITKLTRNQQKVVLSSFSPQEKYDMWITKLSDFILNNDLNNEQRKLVVELQNELKPEIFTHPDEQNEKRLSFVQNRKEYYWQKSVELFGHDEANYLLKNVENVNHAIAKLDNKSLQDTGSFNEIIESRYVPNPIYMCDCESGSCSRITGISWLGIQWEYAPCAVSRCYVEVTFGIWESSNDKRCNWT